jgi:ubiquinone/menaquinone biosynthesis C-methylase UbiE
MRLAEVDPVLREYSRLATRYDARWAFYVDATTRETLARFSVRDTDRVLDVGCGTGALLERLARAHPGVKLTGVDPVPAMLAVARRRLPPGVRLSLGRAEDLPFASGRFTMVVSCNVFHYFRRPEVALREMSRVLAPGGSLVITDWCDDYLACRICDAYLRLVRRSHLQAHGTRECRRLLEEAGYVHVEIERYRISWLWGLMTARATRHAVLPI